ncbi:MAG TPA: hypothetical protein DCS20_02385 [Candidatus Yonathbacteria bacterium]|nr:hypothetical protein [Candidatus Yonathbacteria bacterium]
MPRITLREANAKIKVLERRIKHLERLTTHDSLTELLNRRGMDEALARYFSILSRDTCGKNNFAILNLDLDRFKGINDTYGHQIGDAVIKFFAETLVETLRSYDIAVRLGGDEFVVILPECNFEQAERVKAKIKDTLAANPFTLGALTLSLRTSIGVATALNLENQEVRSLETILDLADKAMYEDKKNGRSQRNP